MFQASVSRLLRQSVASGKGGLETILQRRKIFLESGRCISYVNTKSIHPMSTTRLSTRPAGFTLAEVMIALMIVSTVMIGMIGAIPHAVKSIRESNGITTMGRISQELISDIQMSEWADIDTVFKDKMFYYDNEGLTFQAKKGSEYVFEAKVELPVEPVSLSEQFDYKPDHIRKVKVTVEYTPGGVKAKKEEDRKRRTKTYVFLVANQSQISSTTK
jgi:uncharacterized protein (TIGR02598 family)